MNNDKKTAKEIIEEINQDVEERKNFFILQGKLFFGNRNKQYGIIFAIINIKTEEIIRFNVALSTAHKLRKIEHDSTNKEFIEFFKNISLKDRSHGVNIKLNLETKFKTVGIANLLQYNQEEFEELIQEVIEDTVQENININLSYKLRNKSEMEEIYPQLFVKQEKKKEEKKSLIKLDCDPIIAPVAGRKLCKLEQGEEILVKITDSRSLYFKEELNDLEEEESNKTKGWINKIDLDSDKENIIVQFLPNVYGIINLDKDGKGTGIKLATPQEDKKEEKNITKETAAKNEGGFFTYGLLFLLIIIISSLYLII